MQRLKIWLLPVSYTHLESTFGSEIWWSIRLRRLPDERSYVIRDIPAFLKLVETEGYYQIGKNYYEPLSLLSLIHI